MRKLYFTQRHA